MNSLEFAPLITLLGVLITLWVTIQNSREIKKTERETSLLLQALDTKGQLRIAAIDRRLEAHQESFTKWHELLNASADSISEVLSECGTWWNNNCLYLEPEVRQGFLEACYYRRTHIMLIQASSDSGPILESWNKFNQFPNILFEAIQLPKLTPNEIESLTEGNSRKDNGSHA